MSRAARPAGTAPLRKQLVPQRRRVGRGKQQLDAVLAGVAGAADQHLGAGELPRRGGHARGQRRVGDRLHDLPRARALHGEHRVVRDAIVDLDALGTRRPRVRAKPRQVALVVGGVRDRQVALGVQTVGEEVVEHAAVLAAKHAVLSAADGDRGDVVGEQPLQQRERAGAAGFDLAHVRDVEDPAGLAHGHVLLAHAGVLDRHLPAGELNELCAGGEVALVQDCASRVRGSRC